MKFFKIFLLFFASQVIQADEKTENPAVLFYKDYDNITAKYRKHLAKKIALADKVTIHLLQFDSGKESNIERNDESSVYIGSYQTLATILKSMELNGEDKSKITSLICKTFEIETHSGGAACHFPIHGIKFYKDDHLLYQGSFCWVCKNLSISYPIGAGWLDINDEMQQFFNKHLPIPKSELERFYKKYPGAKPKKEKTK